MVVLNKNFLITQLHGVKLEDRGAVTAYVDAINTLIGNLATCGKKVDDDDRWFYLNNRIPTSWAVFQVVLTFKALVAHPTTVETRRDSPMRVRPC